MGSTYTQIYYHIVFTTKGRAPTLSKHRREDLFRYIWGILKNNKCHLYRIGGVEDHLHLLTSLHPTVALATLIKDIKLASHDWIESNRVFPAFNHWQEGYSAFTQSQHDKRRLIDYIKGQEDHHRKESFRDELRRLLQDAGVEFDEKYLE